jgi:hypothetical protein
MTLTPSTETTVSTRAPVLLESSREYFAPGVPAA